MAAGLTADDATSSLEAWTQLLDRCASHLERQRRLLESIAAGDAGGVATIDEFRPDTGLPPPPPQVHRRLADLAREHEDLAELARTQLDSVTAALAATQGTGVPRRADVRSIVVGELVDRAL